MKRYRLAVVGMVAVLAFGAAGCGGGSEAAEKIAEKAIEEGSGGDVDVDVDSNGENVKVTDKDGNVSEYGTGADLPEGWPEDLKPPKDIEILAASTSTDSGKKTMFVTAQSSAPFDELVDGLNQQLTDAGYELGDSSTIDAGSGGYTGISATGPDYTVTVSLAEDTKNDTTAIAFSLTEV